MQAFERRIIGTLLDTGKRLSPAELALHIDDEKFSYLTNGKRLGQMQQKGWVRASVAGPKKTWEVTDAGKAAHAASSPALAQFIAPATDTAPEASASTETIGLAGAEATSDAAAHQPEIVLHLFKKPDGGIHGKLIGDEGEIGGVCAPDADGVFDALEDSGQRYERVEFHFDPEPAPATESVPEVIDQADVPHFARELHLFRRPDGLVQFRATLNGELFTSHHGPMACYQAHESLAREMLGGLDAIHEHQDDWRDDLAKPGTSRHHTIALPGFTPIEVQGSDEQLVALDALLKTLQESATALDESIGDLELERRQRAEEAAANQRFLERVTRIMGLEETAPNAKEQAIERLPDLANRDQHRPIHRPRHPLDAAFDDAIEQVTRGKGEQRHGKGAQFWQQPWTHYAETHGIGFLTGQAAKKLDEAQGFLNDQPRWEREMLGVIVYAGMAILKARRDVVANMKRAV